MERSPNRVLDLRELARPSFRAAVSAMEALAAREEVSYLHPSKRWEYPWSLERAALKPGARVLDAGCGASIFPVYLATCGHLVSATDLTLPGRLDRLHGVGVDYVRADLVRLPYAEGTFDALFCISVLEHLPRPAMPQALAEMRRVLRPGGRLLLTTDFYHSTDAEIWYEGPGEPFPVDWSFFDAATFDRIVLTAPGFRVAGDIDLSVDWEKTSRQMRRFHGYPYTAVGVALDRI